MVGLRKQLVRLAHENPGLRRHLLPVIRQSSPSKTKYVVVDEGILGAIMGRDIQVLATDVHHTHTPDLLPIPMGGKGMRPATPQDFKVFRVVVPPDL